MAEDKYAQYAATPLSKYSEYEAAPEAAQPAKPSNISKTESLLRGGAQGWTLNYGDELSPHVEKAIAGVAQFLGVGDDEVNQMILDQPTSEMIDEYRKENAEAQAANPKSYMGGQIAGAIGVTAPLAAVTAGSTPAMIATGAGVGGLEAAGGAEGDLSDRLDDAFWGALYGAGTAGLATKLPAIGKGLRDVANRMSVRLLKMPASRIANMPWEKLKQIGQTLVDERLTTKIGTLKGVAGRVQTFADDVGSKIGDIYKRLGAKGDMVDIEDVLGDTIERVRKNPSIAKSSSIPKAEKELVDFLDQFKGSKMSIEDVWNVTKKMEKDARKYLKNVQNADDINRGDLINLVTDEMRGAIAEKAARLDPALAGELKELNHVYKAVAEAAGALDNKLKITQHTGANKIQDLGARIVDTLTGSTPARTATIKTANFLGKVLETPSKLGKWAPILQRAEIKGPSSLAATHFVLMNQDKEYRKKYKEAAEGLE